MIKIALFGGPGVGKTTCANAFVAYMNSKHYPFYNISEYARTFIDTYGQNILNECGPLIQLKIVQKQIEREQTIPNNVKGFITDSPVFLAWFYAAYYGKDNNASYIARKDNYKQFLKSIYSYDHIFRIVRESDYQEDGCRTQTAEEAKLIDEAITINLKLHHIPFTTIKGSTEERVEEIADTVEWLLK